jgi:cyclohexadienyl dehydratase
MKIGSDKCWIKWRMALSSGVAVCVLLGVGGAEAAKIADIQRAGVVRVCVWPDYHGISHRDKRTLIWSGVDIDMAKELAQTLAVKLNFVDSSFSVFMDDVLADKCDVAMFGIGVTPLRAEKVRFTKPYLQTDFVGITPKGNTRIAGWPDIDKPGTVVAVAKGTVHDQVVRERFRHASVMVVEGHNSREHAVQSGRADVFLTDYPYSRRLLEQTDWARAVLPPASFHVTPYAWAVKPGDGEWLLKLDGFLQTVKESGRLRDAAKRHGLEPILVP